MDLQAALALVDTGWIVTATALVFIMQAGFAMLEGGLVRSKNTVNVVMKNYIDMCFGAIAFWLIGYGLMYGVNTTGWFGASEFAPSAMDDRGYAELLFQMVFAATAATIVSGALAERIRYWPYVAVAVLISTFVYPLFGAWAWNEGGWLKQLGFIDFAGATVVHSIGGWVALAGIIVLGPRLGRFPRNNRRQKSRRMADLSSPDLPGHNLPMVALGVFLLWFGFFGFNGGSMLVSEGGIGRIVLNTHLSGAAGVAGAIITMIVLRRPVFMTISLNGGLAGLVAICAGANAMNPEWAVATGFIAGVLMVYATQVLALLKLDDAVGAVPVHGVAGAWGTIAIGLFHKDAMFDLTQVGVQLMGVAMAFAWAFLAGACLFMLVNLVARLRATTSHEQRGLDYSEHAEIGYPEFQQDLMHAATEA